MPIGAGKYDEECTWVREKTQALATIVIVIDGKDGSGFSCQANLLTTLALPEILERVAQDMRRNFKETTHDERR